MSGGVLTMADVLQACNRVRQLAPTLSSLVVVESEFLSEPRPLSRWERLRVRIENAADRAELIYPFNRVQRTQPLQTAIRIGDRLYCHPVVARKIKAEALATSGLRYY